MAVFFIYLLFKAPGELIGWIVLLLTIKYWSIAWPVWLALASLTFWLNWKERKSQRQTEPLQIESSAAKAPEK